MSNVDGWKKKPDEMALKVNIPELSTNLLGSKVRIPKGCMGVHLEYGSITETKGGLYHPGYVMGESWLNKIGQLFAQEPDKNEYYLVDTGSATFELKFEVPQGEVGTMLEVHGRIAVEIGRSEESVTRFLQEVLGDKEKFTKKELLSLVQSTATQITKSVVTASLSEGSPNWSDIENRTTTKIETDLASRFGLSIRVHLNPEDTATTTYSWILGESALPMMKTCVECNWELPSSAAFCAECGSKQPKSVAGVAAVSIISADNQHLEVDLITRIRHPKSESFEDKTKQATISALGQIFRTQKLADFQGNGFQEFNALLLEKIQTVVGAMGLEVCSSTIVDIRSKSGQWMQDARAEIEQYKASLEIDKQWLDAKGLENQLALQAFEISREQNLALERSRLTVEFASDQAELDDRQKRQELLDAESKLDIADAQRDANQQQQEEDAQRNLDRHRTQEQHQDAKTSIELNRDLEQQQDANQQAKDVTDLEHQIGMEKVAAAHDVELSQQANRLKSETARLESDDLVYRKSAEQDLALKQTAQEQDLELEKLAKMQELDAAMTRQEQTHELNKMTIETENKERLMQGKTTEQILAMQASELAKTEHGSAALAEALGSNKVLEAEKEARERESNIKDAAMQGQQDMMEKMMGMMQQNMDTVKTMAQDNAAQLGSLAEKSVESAAQATASDAVKQAHKDNADNSQKLAEKTVEMTGKVASTVAGSLSKQAPAKKEADEA
jgi:hypothetical protein